MDTYVIEVNEPTIYATGRGAEEWTLFRANTVLGRRFEAVGFHTPMGSKCLLPFGTKAEADEFAAGIVEYLKVPATAVKVKRAVA
jgi:hypothetical protein